MSQRNRKHNYKQRRSRYLLFTGILCLAAVSASCILWFDFSHTAKKDGVMEEAPITITESGIQAKEEIKKTVMGTADSGEPQEVEENLSSAQEPGIEEPWNLMLVNKENAVPDNYEVNLVEVEGGERVDERIYEPLMEMLYAAKEGNLGVLPMVVSGYRTQEKQQSLYEEKIAKFKGEGYSDSEAVNLAEQWVAVPGYSEHQLGFAVDINGATYDVYLWLQENSYKYGFIFRYPGTKTDITKTAEEVWHYRYVGKEAAKEIYDRGICLEEYLEER